MLTPKQNLLETLKKDGKPECLCNSLTMFRTIPGDPCFKLLRQTIFLAALLALFNEGRSREISSRITAMTDNNSNSVNFLRNLLNWEALASNARIFTRVPVCSFIGMGTFCFSDEWKTDRRPEFWTRVPD